MNFHHLAYWQDKALSLAIENRLFINGEYTAAAENETFETVDPVTQAPLAKIARGKSVDIDRAMSAARGVFERGDWSLSSPAKRKAVLNKLADLMEAHAEELALLETLDTGKPIRHSLRDDIPGAARAIRWYAEAIDKVYGEVATTSSHELAMIVREPVGVIAAIVPWNFPLMIGMWKVMPALAAGCSIVIKPSETTPLTMLRVAELASEAGIPDGVFNVVTGSGAVCGAALTSHPHVAKISFTGSTATGKGIARTAADRLTRVTLELGGKNPAIVLKDADPQWVIEGLMTGSFLNQGQVCAASSRIYIEAPLFDTLVSGFEQAVKSLQVGPGMSPVAQINPLVSRAHCGKVCSFLDDAQAQQAELIRGSNGPAGEGYYVAPTLVVNPDAKLRLTREEVFGPVVNLVRVADGEEALQLANDTEYGLTASVWTQNLSQALEYSDRLQAGTVWVNSHTLIDANLPFGGMKQSGTGRDFGPDWLDGWCETKSVCVRY